MASKIFKGMKVILKERESTTRSAILGVSVPNFVAPLPRSHGLPLYPPNVLLTARLPDRDFSPRGTLGSAVLRRCSSPGSTRNLILSSNAGGVRGGIIVDSLLRQGRKTLEQMPPSHCMELHFSSCVGKIYLSFPPTLLIRSFQFLNSVNPVRGCVP